MKKLIIPIFCLFLFTLSLKAQCVVPSGFVCLPQADVDKISKDLAELKQSRIVIADFKSERGASDVLVNAYKAFATSSNDLVAALQKQVTDQITINQLQQKLLETAYALVDKLTQQINKPKSGFQKFIQTVEKIVYLAAGVLIGSKIGL